MNTKGLTCHSKSATDLSLGFQTLAKEKKKCNNFSYVYLIIKTIADQKVETYFRPHKTKKNISQ